jgi:hypothetical protein
VRRHAIQFFNENGERLSWSPCVIMDSAEPSTLILELLFLCSSLLLATTDLDVMFIGGVS